MSAAVGSEQIIRYPSRARSASARTFRTAASRAVSTSADRERGHAAPDLSRRDINLNAVVPKHLDGRDADERSLYPANTSTKYATRGTVTL